MTTTALTSSTSVFLMRLTTKLAAGSDQDNDDDDNVTDSMTSRMIGVAVKKSLKSHRVKQNLEIFDGKEKSEQVVKKMEMSERNFSCG